MDELTLLANKYGTDKGSEDYYKLKAKNYTRIYDEHFSDIRNEKLVILELGIQNGGSLFMWRDYFVSSEIIGMDLQRKCLANEDKRISVCIGDCTDHKVLDKLFHNKEFDIVIDDASHDTYDIIKSYNYLRPKTTKFYCIEDLHAAIGVPRWLKDENIDHEIINNLAIIPC